MAGFLVNLWRLLVVAFVVEVEVVVVAGPRWFCTWVTVGLLLCSWLSFILFF